MSVAVALCLMFTDPMTKDLGSPAWSTREKQTKLLQDAGWFGVGVGLLNIHHLDPEVRGRCWDLILREERHLPYQHWCVFAYCVLQLPQHDDEAGQWFFWSGKSYSIAEKYAINYPKTWTYNYNDIYNARSSVWQPVVNTLNLPTASKWFR